MILSIYSKDSFNSYIQHRFNVLLREVFPSCCCFFVLSSLTCKHHTYAAHSPDTSACWHLCCDPWAAGSEVIIRAWSICSLTPAVYLDYRDIDRPSLTGSAWLRNTGWCSRLTKNTCEMRLHPSNFCQHWHGMAWQRHSRRVRLVATTDSAFQACKKKHRSESVGKIIVVITFNPM